jgi:hypothetical protein
MPSLVQRIGSGISSAFQGLFGGNDGASLTPISRETVAGLFGPPRPPDLSRDQIVSDIIQLPYRGPLDLGNYEQETWEMRARYRKQRWTSPVVVAAMDGKDAAVSCADVAVLPGEDNDKFASLIAEFVDWTITNAPGGWVKLIEDVYTSARVDGYSVCAKKLKVVRWRGRDWWGFDHTRQLDSQFIRLQLDVYRNPVAVVNFVRGMEYYDPRQVILYTHRPMYSNPFGHSELRGATAGAQLIEDAYKVWYLAMKVYGLPYMIGKYGSATQKDALAKSLKALREGGYLTISKDDEVDTLNLAASAGTQMFRDFVQVQREDVFFATRGASQPFMEGDGGSDAHTDTGVQKVATDALEYRDLLKVADTLRHQLFRWLVEPNFGEDAPIPKLKLGGTDWKETQTIVEVVGKAREQGAKVSASQFQTLTGIAPPRDDDDELGASESSIKGTTEGLNAITTLQKSFYLGEIPQAAAVATLKTLFGFSEEEATSLLPTTMPVDRTDTAKQQAQQPQQAAPAPQPFADVATFSAGHDAVGSWDDKVAEILEKLTA